MLRTPGVHPYILRDGYTVLDTAVWAECRGAQGAQQVVRYLRNTYPDMPSGHRPSKGKEHLPKNWLFRAASDGCLECVKHFLQKEEFHPVDVSDPLEYTALDMAVWAKCKGVRGAQEVVQYLRDTYPEMPSGHRPPKRHAHLKHYWLFQAASDGCLECVKHFLKKNEVDPFCVSETQEYTVLDMAKWAQYRGVEGAKEVVKYLLQTYPRMPCAEYRVVRLSQLRWWDYNLDCWNYPAEEYERWQAAKAAGEYWTAHQWFLALEWRYCRQQEHTACSFMQRK